MSKDAWRPREKPSGAIREANGPSGTGRGRIGGVRCTGTERATRSMFQGR